MLELTRLLHKRMIDCYVFNDTATTEIYTLSLHDALPISPASPEAIINYYEGPGKEYDADLKAVVKKATKSLKSRSEEHTSELQSRQYLVCRLLLEKKKVKCIRYTSNVVATRV